MPLIGYEYLSKTRCQFKSSLSAIEVLSLAKDKNLGVLQTCYPVEPETWDLLNKNLFAKRHDVELRVYGFYQSDCDLSFLTLMSNVRRFSADCLMNATGVEHIAELQDLESLGIGIFSLENFDFLAYLPTQLRGLFLGATKSKQPRLQHLSRLKELRKLSLEGQQKDLDVIEGLTALEDLTLRSIGPANLQFLRSLNRLWSLDIKLGGLRDLSALDGLNQIKYLELWQVRGLCDINVISTMRGLQHLFLQSLPNVTELPDLSKLKALRRIHLQNMKGLKQLKAIATAPALETFYHFDARGMQPEMYEEILKLSTLKVASVGLGSDKKNGIFEKMATQHGIEFSGREPFVFR